MVTKSEEILENLANVPVRSELGLERQGYSRSQLMAAALFGIKEMHEECVELLAKHSPFRKLAKNKGLWLTHRPFIIRYSDK